MESYIHLYETNDKFTAAYNGPDYKEPWLSLTEENMKVNYNKPKLTAIAFDNITWVTDVPATGGTATKDNCTFKVNGIYEDGTSVDISSDATVTGELVVPSSTATTRQSVGTLTLTAKYKGVTCTGSVVAYQKKAVDLKEPLTFKISSPGTINWTAIKDSPKTIEYKLNNGEWILIKSTSASAIVVNADDKIQFRGNNATYSNGSYYTSTFSGSTAGFDIEGNIMSLINSRDFATLTTLQRNNTFCELFEGCTGLTSAENLILPATTLTEGCYKDMFLGCSSLTTAPALPAKTLAYNCYYEMFKDCIKLTTAPELPATTLADYCYNNMFKGCSSLTTAPSILPANTLVESCYSGMFNGCRSLTTAPVLPATTLASYCYNSMFWNCRSLNYIKCLATNIPSSSTGGWVSGVASKGTFVKNPSMSGWATGSDGIPSGWTVQNA